MRKKAVEEEDMFLCREKGLGPEREETFGG